MGEFDLVMPKGANKGRKILGRGSSSGWGKTAGKGNKGQKARSGGKVYAGFEGGQMPLYRRLAKKGFSNYPFSKEYVAINLSLLEAKFDDEQIAREREASGHQPGGEALVGDKPIENAQERLEIGEEDKA